MKKLLIKLSYFILNKFDSKFIDIFKFKSEVVDLVGEEYHNVSIGMKHHPGCDLIMEYRIYVNPGILVTGETSGEAICKVKRLLKK